MRAEINNLKQGNKPVLDYFTELRGLWEELNSHRPIPSCTCAQQCRCDAMRSAREFRLEDQIIQYLTGLNEKFSVIKTQDLLLDPLPSINKVYSMVVQEESNNIFVLSQPDSNSTIDEANRLVNAYDSRKFAVNLPTLMVEHLTIRKMVEYALFVTGLAIQLMCVIANMDFLPILPKSKH